MVCVIWEEILGNGFKMSIAQRMMECQMMEVLGVVFQIASPIPVIIAVFYVEVLGTIVCSVYALQLVARLHPHFLTVEVEVALLDKKEKEKGVSLTV